MTKTVMAYWLCAFLGITNFSSDALNPASPLYARVAALQEDGTFLPLDTLVSMNPKNVDACYRFTIDKNNRVASAAYMQRGDLSNAANLLGAAELQFRYDRLGNCTEKTKRNAQGKTLSSELRRYTGKNRIEELYRDASGKTVGKTLREYDAQNRLTRTTFSDAAGKIQNNAFGTAQEVYTYTANDTKPAKVDFLDAEKKLIRRVTSLYDASAMLTEESVFYAAENLTEKTTFEYDAKHRLTARTELPSRKTTRYRYDAAGRVTEESVYDVSGNLSENTVGIASTATEYFANGKPRRLKHTDAKKILRLDEQFNDYGLPTDRAQFASDGSLIERTKKSYDALGNLRDESFFKLAGGTAEMIFEKRLYDAGRLVKKQFFDKSGAVKREE
jgi:YD repeat-containing protein